ncbi:hypothetical protein [Halomarina rubra]|uniref:Uncharacterized protein n=1 Tax=Halomarina rubra TaxID=2071873 RepID=A0ABD6AQH7_9EURY|nr:hypothetical protein [Halomarina rubra]
MSSETEPRIASWSYAPVGEHGVDATPPADVPVWTTYDPVARTVVVTGEQFTNGAGQRTMPTDVTVEDDVLHLRFERLPRDESSAHHLDERDRRFALHVRFDARLPKHTAVVVVADEAETTTGWQNPAGCPADD